jgi:hypothetical protein
MTLRDSKTLAHAIFPELNFFVEIEKAVEKEYSKLIPVHNEYFKDEIDGFRTDRYKGIQAFLDYAVRGDFIDYSEGIQIRKIAEINPDDREELDAVVDLVYTDLSEKSQDNIPSRGAIDTYLHIGEVDTQTLNWLVQNFNPLYDMPTGYIEQGRGKGKQKKKVGQDSYVEGMIISVIDAIKQGEDYQGEIQLGDFTLNVPQRLREVTGVEPKPYFVMTIDDVVEGQNTDGLIVPFHYNSRNGTNVPDELKSSFMPVDELGQIISFFDMTLGNLLVVYAQRHQKIMEIYNYFRDEKGVGVREGVFIRALFPEDHEPTLTLYTDNRLMVTKDERGRMLMDITRNERAKITGGVADYFGISEEQIKMEELVSLQAQLMQLLPMSAFICADTTHRIHIYNEIPKKLRRQFESPVSGWRAIFRTHNSKLQRDFNVNFERITELKKSSSDNAISLFGEEYRFIQDIVLKKASE